MVTSGAPDTTDARLHCPGPSGARAPPSGGDKKNIKVVFGFKRDSKKIRPRPPHFQPRVPGTGWTAEKRRLEQAAAKSLVYRAFLWWTQRDRTLDLSRVKGLS